MGTAQACLSLHFSKYHTVENYMPRHISFHFRLNFIMEANTMDSGQAAPLKEQSDLGPYCFRNRLPILRFTFYLKIVAVCPANIYISTL